ncbi:MAG: TolC family protein, partial [Blastocatellia bacterium]|nr:TolC family protein [Blastocatellia bacterium]
MQRKYSLILTLLLTFSLTDIVGADTGDPQSGRRIPPQQSPTSGPTPMVLRLDDLLRQVDLYHPKLQGADAERRVASAKRLEKQGAFDPVFLLGSDYLRYNSTSSRGKQLDASQNDLQVEFLTRSGIKVFAGTRLNVGTVKSPLSSTGDAGEYFLGVKIPLMRSFRINEKAAAEKQAKIGEPLADAEFQEKRLELFQKAATSYWEWVGAKRRLDVSRNLLELARIRAEAIRERVKAGDLPQIDSTEADQEVERRRGSLLKSDRDLQKATFKLALFLWEPDGNPSPLPTAASVPAVTSD